MSAITFDTLKFADRIEKAGASRELATALAEAQKESLSEVLDSTLATKSDIHGIRLNMEILKTEIKTDIAGLRGEITSIKWMMGALVALATANFAKQFF
jgi:hypothetical protein